MIGRLSGKLLEKNPPQILVDVNGVGYELDVPMSTFFNLPNLQDNVVLHIQQIVREDAHLLYGFLTLDERSAFRALIRISGVGPKLALAVLSGLSLNELNLAVSNKDANRLTKVPGIGKKTAERLMLELQGKFSINSNNPSSTQASSSASTHSDDIINALLALGYNHKEAEWAIKQLASDIGVSDGIRQALKLLSKA